ncbi:MAG: DUF424 family protein [Methanothrix sp.]|jgi:hypothetical protein|uniref:DUF424 domain-containing protein n=1 Tax=Methanothrix sp. TaxID=90426 RepID=UPI002BFABABE|nr:DUF424 family protein [Methanothrix sp.]
MEMEDSIDQVGRKQVGRKAPEERYEDEAAQICLKTYRHGKETLIAVCDSEILGCEFREGDLHIEVCSDFYGEERASLSQVEEALRGATMANFVGRKTIRYAISLGYVNEENVLSIDGVLYAQMVRM